VVHTRSTKPEIRVEVCSKCHPFFTGKQKFMDTAGRVERFHGLSRLSKGFEGNAFASEGLLEHPTDGTVVINDPDWSHHYLSAKR